MPKTRLTRRAVITKSLLGGASAALPTIFTSRSASAFVNEPTGGTVTLGLTVPLSGSYADEGADELRGYMLAIEHLNGAGDGGMLQTFSSQTLRGNGILGKKVNSVQGDTENSSAVARDLASNMIRTKGATMVSGGSSSGVAVAVQSLCQEAGVIFMVGLSHSNDTTGKDKRAHGFRHFFNSYMSGVALAPVLERLYGPDRKAYHLTADYNWGDTTEDAIVAATENMGWETIRTARTQTSQTDFREDMRPVLQSDADVLVLNQFGGNMMNSLTAAVQSGLRDRLVNGKNFEIVIPLYTRLMARAAGENIKGIVGSANWHWTLPDAGSNAFVNSFIEKYGVPPSQAAHTCYAQTLLYADAVERAKTFDPCGVIEALEGFEFDGLGGGATLYRAQDHQCFKDVLVVRGKQNPASEFDLLEIVDTTPLEDVVYPHDHPQFAGGDLGACNADS